MVLSSNATGKKRMIAFCSYFAEGRSDCSGASQVERLNPQPWLLNQAPDIFSVVCAKDGTRTFI
eukprot:12909481-Prorocentrum_lima.AAC.1